MLVRSVEVKFQGWYWWLGRQNKSPGLEGHSVPQFPCCGGTECPPGFSGGHRNVEEGYGQGWLGASPHLPVLHRLARRLPIPCLEQGLLLLLF